MFRYLIRSMSVVFIGWAIFTSFNAHAQEDDKPFYAGKTITMMVGVPGGSGGDVSARTMAKEWEKRIPGNPYIIVKNLEGAGGSTVLNYIYEKAKPDGLTVFYGPWNPLDVLAKGAGIRYVPEKFSIIGSGTGMRGLIVRTDVKPGITKPDDLLKVSRLKVGGRSPNNVLDMIGNLSLKILGVNFKYVAGYRGMSQISAAIYGSEVQAGHMAAGGFRRFFRETTKNGETLAAYHHTIFDRNGNALKSTYPLGDSENFLDVYKRIHGSEPSGIYWETFKWLRINVHGTTPCVLAPPGTPDHHIEILRRSIEATFHDPEFQKLWLKQFSEVLQWNDIEDTLSAFKNYRNISKDKQKVLDEMRKVAWD